MMNMDITRQERNDLLEREELELAIDHTGEPTPPADDIRSQLAAEQDLDPATIRVDHVYSSTGRGTSSGTVTVFDEPVIDLPDDETDTEAAEEDEEPADEDASTEEETAEDEEPAEETDADETVEEDEDTEE
jgi:ribosomal protein S24E